MRKSEKINRIHVVTKYFLPVTAGIEVNILETYKHFLEKGFDVTIHTSTDTHLKRNVLKLEDTMQGLKIKRYFYKNSIMGFVPNIDWDQESIVCLHNFNVWYFWILMKVMMLKFFGKKKFKLIITPHGGFTPEWRVFGTGEKIFKYAYHFLLGTNLINYTADLVRTVSIWEKTEMVKKGVDVRKIKVVENGLEDEAFLDVEEKASMDVRKTVDNLGAYILQIGRIYPIKNYETVIKSLPLLRDKKVKFVIVGQPEKNAEYKDELIALSGRLGVENRLVFLGVIRGVDKYFVIKKAKLMVHMAIWESFCNVVHEGLSQGLVCIVANNTALRYLVKNGKNGYLVETKSEKELAKKIDYVLQNYNSPSIKLIRKNNLKVSRGKTWRNTAETLIKYYEKIN